MKYIQCMLFPLGLAVAMPAFAEPTMEEILKKADDLFRQDHSIVTMEMTVKTSRYERNMKMKAVALGTEKTMITILEPAKESGTVTLKVDDNIWNYLPKVDRVMKVPSGMMGGSWMGSHVSNDDLVRENRFSEDFDSRFIHIPTDGNHERIYEIELVPKESTAVVWGKIVTRSREDLLPLDVKYYDEDGTLKRIDKFEDVKEFGGVLLPTKFSVIPQDKEGEYTTMTYTNVDFVTPVSADMFSLQALRK
jgi:outer membrane lipoprotein-sorting protein